MAFDGITTIVAGVAVLLGVLWLSWRRPTVVLLAGLLSLAIRPEILLGGPALEAGWGIHHTVVAVGLLANLVVHGFRLQAGWPLSALIVTFALGLVFGDLHPQLTLPLMVTSLLLLALPFTFTQVVLAPGSRRAYAYAIMLAPLLSVVLGALLDLVGLMDLVFVYSDSGAFRLQGATGNALVFAFLAFAGFAVALHRTTRSDGVLAAGLAAVNLALLLLSGARMGLLAAGLLAILLVLTSPDLRTVFRRHARLAALGVVLLAGVFLLYWPSLEFRLFDDGDGGEIKLSGRDRLWSFYFEEYLLSPFFGRGFGAGFVAADGFLNFELKTPHNEYLHLLVVGGAVGFILCAVSIIAWGWRLLRIVSPNDRAFLTALFPSLALYAITDNLLIYSSCLAIYAYLGTMLVKPARQIGDARPHTRHGVDRTAPGRAEEDIAVAARGPAPR